MITGVAPAGFGFPEATGMPTLLRFPRPDLWMPLAFTDKEKVESHQPTTLR